MEEGEVPVVTVTFEREELYVLPEIAFRYYEAPAIEAISDDIPRTWRRIGLKAN